MNVIQLARRHHSLQSDER